MPSTPDQLINQATRHAVHLEQLKTQTYNDMRTIMQDAHTKLIARLSRVREGSSWTRARLEAKIEDYRKMLLRESGPSMIQSLNRRTRQVAQYEAGYEQRALQNVYPKHQWLIPTENQLMTAVNSTPLNLGGRFEGSLLGELHKDFADNQIKTLTRNIRSAFAGGQTTQELIRHLRQEVFPVSRQQLEAVVRTSLQHGAAQARRATFEKNSDIIKGYRIIATLDVRTSSECRFRDGMVEPMDNPELPPYHFNCRTTFTAVLDDRFAFLDDEGTRSVRDPKTGKVKQINAKLTYYEWLRRQPTAFQDDVLGPARGKLFRSGNLSTQRFKELQLDKNFKPRTIAQMMEIEPLAFGIMPKVVERPTPKTYLDFSSANLRGVTRIELEKAGGEIFTEEQRVLAASLPMPKEIVRNNGEERGKYQANSSRIVYDADSVFAHEYGHHIDQMLGNRYSETPGLAISLDDGAFELAMKKDAKKLNIIGRSDESINARAEWARDVGKEYGKGDKIVYWYSREGTAISDIFDALTDGEMFDDLTIPGHGKDYYSRRYKAQNQEVFANLWQLKGSGHWEDAQKYFPEVTKRFDEILDGAAKGDL